MKRVAAGAHLFYRDARVLHPFSVGTSLHRAHCVVMNQMLGLSKPIRRSHDTICEAPVNSTLRSINVQNSWKLKILAAMLSVVRSMVHSPLGPAQNLVVVVVRSMVHRPLGPAQNLVVVRATL